MHNRRQILALGAGGAALGAVAAVGWSGDALAGFGLGGPGDLANPAEIRSEAGVLRATLRPTLSQALVCLLYTSPSPRDRG